MKSGGRLSSTERRSFDDLHDALTSSLDLRAVLTDAFPSLARLVGADHAAVGITTPGSTELEWIAPQMAPQFFESYQEMAPHDFVRAAVSRSPNVVLRDTEMVSRAELESNPMHRRARELGMPLEQVMSVLLHTDEQWLSGLALYRSRRRPFSERDRVVLQRVTRPLSHAVRNCRAFAALACQRRLLDALPEDARGFIVVSQTQGELTRSATAARLLEKWFAPVERPGPLALPDALLEKTSEWVRSSAAPAPFRRSRAGAELIARPRWIRDAGTPYLVIELEEVPPAPGVPPAWRQRLTARECQVAEKLMLGWDNQLIASELGCARETVKQHLKHIYDKLGISSRGQLVAAAHRKLDELR